MGANYVPSTPQDVDAEPSGSVSAHNQATDAHADIRTAIAGKQDAGAYLTSETDPNVPAWAKAPTKPTYNAAEVGAEASGTAASAVSTHNASGTAHSDIRSALSTKADLVEGLVPANQLPSYVDDVLEYATFSSLPATGVAGKIYVTLDTNLTYRWSGTSYVEISASLALGETAATAYRGDRGKVAYDHSQSPHAPIDAEKNVQGDWSVSDNTNDAYIANKPVLASVATSGSYNDLSNKPTIVTVWSGTQAQFDAMTEAQKNAITFNAVIG